MLWLEHLRIFHIIFLLTENPIKARRGLRINLLRSHNIFFKALNWVRQISSAPALNLLLSQAHATLFRPHTMHDFPLFSLFILIQNPRVVGKTKLDKFAAVTIICHRQSLMKFRMLFHFSPLHRTDWELFNAFIFSTRRSKITLDTVARAFVIKITRSCSNYLGAYKFIKFIS